MNTFSEHAAIIGIDQVEREHDLCLKVLIKDALAFSIQEHKPEIIDDRANELRMRFGGKSVAICIESRKVP